MTVAHRTDLVVSLALVVTTLAVVSWSSAEITMSRDGDGKYPGAGRIAQAGAVEMDLAIPERLKVPATQALVLRAHATGVQIYECDARNDDPTRFEWIFKATEAELLNRAGERIGQHSAGPAWESTDGSKVVAEVTALHPGPDPQRHSVVVADRDIQFWKSIRRLRSNTEYPARPHDGRQAVGTDVSPWSGRQAATTAVRGH